MRHYLCVPYITCSHTHTHTQNQLYVKLYITSILSAAARTTTSISSLVAVVTSFFDAQFMFCWIEKSLRPRAPLNQNETVSDIEYIIPRVSMLTTLCNLFILTANTVVIYW